MKHLFLPYPLALIAKEKGFNEPCLTSFHKNGDLAKIPVNEGEVFYMSNKEFDYLGCSGISAPLYQQIVDWFRERHKVLIEVCHSFDGGNLTYQYSVIQRKTIGSEYTSTVYYEALDKAIEEAFKLI
ncbi:MAG: hypothetical protein V4721_10345 [Bacteroidota bacterium]